MRKFLAGLVMGVLLMALIEISTRIYQFIQDTVTPLGAELLLNPGFETAGAGDPDLFADWFEGYGDHTTPSADIDDDVVDFHGGAHAAHIHTTEVSYGGWREVSQVVAVTERTPYRLSFWTHGDGVNPARYAVRDLTNNHLIIPATYTGVPGAAWTQVTVDFWTPLNCVSIRVQFANALSVGATGYWDDVSLKEINMVWVENEDVLQEPSPTWDFGLPGAAPLDLVANTGILTFTLDNSEANSSGLSGYYTPGHTNCPVWFTDGLKFKVECEREDTHVATTRFIGRMVAARPSSGMYRDAKTEVEAHDWMEYASTQKIGQLAIQSGAGLGADDALTTMLDGFGVQPEATDFDVGKETFTYLFNTDDSDRQTMMALFQKYARNELFGYIFLEGDGTLRFDNRHARPATTVNAFTLDATASTPMNELEVAWDTQDIKNRIDVRVYPTVFDTGADTILWKLQDGFQLASQQTIVLTCPYSDPSTGRRISASNVVTPLVSATHIKFGSGDDGSSNDMIAQLTWSMIVGGNSAEVTLTNSGATPGYVNFIEILGDGMYTYDPMTMTSLDAASIAAKGEKVLAVPLEQMVNSARAQSMADYLKGQLLSPKLRVERIRFLANFSGDFATAALTAEVNTRFAMVEYQAGVSGAFYICHLRYEKIGPLLWVEIVPAPAEGGGAVNYFIWDSAGHGWDEGAWAF